MEQQHSCYIGTDKGGCAAVIFNLPNIEPIFSVQTHK